jgi:glycosyltransferase involved in cell wall biosynthesis
MRLPQTYSFDIILAADASTDRTMEIGEKILGNKGLVVNTSQGNVGCARKIAANTALKRFGTSKSLEQCWLANTDADCKVPSSWLIDQIEWANTGIQALAGIVKVDSFFEHAPWVSKRFQEEYILHPDGTHPHVHGSNFGVRADAYQRVGGWQDLETAEDHDLWNRLLLLGVPVLSPSKLWVYTSGRIKGRAPKGFADTLAGIREK